MQMAGKVMKYLFGNRRGQAMCEYAVRKATELMGIGSGDDVATSGEHSVLSILERQFPAPYCIFDVGANRGQFMEMVVSCLNTRDYTVHCFEPSKSAFAVLAEKASGNGRVVLNNIGLGDKPGEFTLYYNEPGSEIASLTQRRLDHLGIDFSQSETVRIDTLDSYCETRGIVAIDLLKLDVEGHELDVLEKGSLNMFGKGAIKMVSFEFGGCNIDTRTFFQDFFYFFKDRGMKIYRITPSGYMHHVDTYSEILEQFRTTNFLATGVDLQV